MQSILSKANAADIRSDPFPHVIVKDALDWDVYNELERDFPNTNDIIPNGKLCNAKASINAVNIINNPAISPAWQNFAEYHSSPKFYGEVVDLFGNYIRKIYPFLESDFGKPLETLETKRRNMGERKGAHRSDDVVLDCQIMVDDTRDARVCRGPHVDAAEELYAALFYFRHPNDTSEGGELCVLQANNPTQLFPASNAIRIKHRPAELDDCETEIVTKVPYAANTAVIFINSAKSLHKVTMRSATPVRRRHINVIGESYSLKQGGLFSILKPDNPVMPPNHPSIGSRLYNKVKRLF